MFNHIVAKVPLIAATWEDAIRQLGGALQEAGYVKETFIPAVVAREIEFPTGLEAPSIGVAIPHTDACHVSDSAIAIGLLKKPIPFGKMGGCAQETVDVSVVILMAVDHPEQQVPAILRLLGILQDQKAIQRVASSPTGDRLEEVISLYLR